MKHYTLDYKLRALALAEDVGVPAAASQLRIPRQRLYEWVRDENYLLDCWEEQQKRQEQERKSRTGSGMRKNNYD